MNKMLKEIADYLQERFPICQQEEWDNCGLLFPWHHDCQGNILLCLDIDDNVVKYAISQQVGLIISHHPFLKDQEGRSIDLKEQHLQDLLNKNKTNVLSLHTCCDNDQNGLNRYLLNLLPVKEIKVFDAQTWPNFLVASVQDKVDWSRLKKEIQNKLGSDHVLTNFEQNISIKTIALCSGSGSSIFKKYFNCSPSKIDLWLTGDVKYHDWLYANSFNVKLGDIGHQVEHKFVDFIKQLIVKKFDYQKILVWSKVFWPIDWTKKE